MSRNTCSLCGGNGKCHKCDGTGINPHFNESEPKCSTCSGVGVCPECLGTARWYVLPPEIIDPGLNNL